MAKSFFVVPTATTTADTVAVGAASAQFPNIIAMAAGEYYLFTSSTACWIQQGTNPTASAAAGSMFVPPNVQVYIHGGNGSKLAVIQAAAVGTASLVRLQGF